MFHDVWASATADAASAATRDQKTFCGNTTISGLAAGGEGREEATGASGSGVLSPLCALAGRMATRKRQATITAPHIEFVINPVVIKPVMIKLVLLARCRIVGANDIATDVLATCPPDPAALF